MKIVFPWYALKKFLILTVYWVTMLLHEDVIINGLLFERICDDANCPMLPAYELPLKDRVLWAMALSREEKKRIVDHYYECISKLDSHLNRIGIASDAQILTDYVNP
ncbi:hypothetical protein [Desulfopila aestuarii]|nr:hypothetical protein [Desulfopila aestuarii]